MGEVAEGNTSAGANPGEETTSTESTYLATSLRGHMPVRWETPGSTGHTFWRHAGFVRRRDVLMPCFYEELHPRGSPLSPMTGKGGVRCTRVT